MSAVSVTSSLIQRAAAVDERLPFSLLLPLAVQHVLEMYAGAVAVPLIVGRAVNLAPDQMAFLISADLFAGGLATLVQSFGLPGIEIRLPVMMGVTFASVGPMLAMAATPDVGIHGIYGSVCSTRSSTASPRPRKRSGGCSHGVGGRASVIPRPESAESQPPDNESDHDASE